LIAAVATPIEASRLFLVPAIAQPKGVLAKTIQPFLTKKQGLVKKSAHWVPKLLTQEQLKERV